MFLSTSDNHLSCTDAGKSPAGGGGNLQSAVVLRAGGAANKPWMPRIWSGITLGPWLKLLIRNRFRIAPSRWPMALLTTFFAFLITTPLAWIQRLIFGRRIRRQPLVKDPIFVIGHWRTGTTFLHELLVLDPDHTSPTSYQCFAPEHFLVSRRWLGRLVERLIPKQRPQDDMPFGFDLPQEDEFGLCLMGAGSPYSTLAFPNHPPQEQNYLDMEGLSPQQLAGWKDKLVRFLRSVALQTPKRLVLKSPAHLGRIATLLELFPDAQFVHIYRDPFAVFPSTLNLWRRFYRDQGLQRPRYEGLEEYVLHTFNRLYRAFGRAKSKLKPGQLCEVRFEELVVDPIGQMRRVYEELSLGDFDRLLPQLEQFVNSRRQYQPNRYDLPEFWRQRIVEEWGWFFDRYGYSKDPGLNREQPLTAEAAKEGRSSSPA